MLCRFKCAGKPMYIDNLLGLRDFTTFLHFPWKTKQVMPQKNVLDTNWQTVEFKGVLYWKKWNITWVSWPHSCLFSVPTHHLVGVQKFGQILIWILVSKIDLHICSDFTLMSSFTTGKLYLQRMLWFNSFLNGFIRENTRKLRDYGLILGKQNLKSIEFSRREDDCTFRAFS